MPVPGGSAAEIAADDVPTRSSLPPPLPACSGADDFKPARPSAAAAAKPLIAPSTCGMVQRSSAQPPRKGAGGGANLHRSLHEARGLLTAAYAVEREAGIVSLQRADGEVIQHADHQGDSDESKEQPAGARGGGQQQSRKTGDAQQHQPPQPNARRVPAALHPLLQRKRRSLRREKAAALRRRRTSQPQNRNHQSAPGESLSLCIARPGNKGSGVPAAHAACPFRKYGLRG